jgi:MoaA/NifB/PqqE/SkfB family radical SAM enzyme
MCHVWQNPTDPKNEVSLDTLKKIPSGICCLNLTGGEPTLRNDLLEIVDTLYPKADTLEISSNGLLAERLEPIVQKYPDVKIRFSLEGSEETNNRIRGERDGYRKKIEGLFKLQKLGAKDIGIATVIQDDNAEEILNLFQFTKKHGFEFATSTLHNGFQFHKYDNTPSDRMRLAKRTEELVTEMLKGYSVKNWFRAYLNLGLIAKILGQNRILQCTAATDFIFIDPGSDVYACNVRPDLRLGNLKNQEWDEIWQSPVVREIKNKISRCTNNCWMVGSAKTVMRSRKYPRLPGIVPLKWVIYNKLRIIFGGKINFDRYLDYNSIRMDLKESRSNIFVNGKVNGIVLPDDSGDRKSREFTKK